MARQLVSAELSRAADWPRATWVGADSTTIANHDFLPELPGGYA
jgi:hypothetical protein